MERKFDSIKEAIDEIKAGNFVIVVDDEDRENEGDFICAAEKITPEMVNFMLSHGRGVLCAPLTEERCDELELEMQVNVNTSFHSTPFTISVDKLEGCTTGVSTADRAATFQALADPSSTPETFGRPGHIFPLRARTKGVLRRAGHTEAAVDLLIELVTLQYLHRAFTWKRFKTPLLVFRAFEQHATCGQVYEAAF